MSSTGTLIQPRRLRRLPSHLRLAHEYVFFLHDEAARLLVEYEAGEGHLVKVNFDSKREGREFQRLTKAGRSGIEALRDLGYAAPAQRVILNTITMAMVSDCLHHIYEALVCLEKRKVVVACNLLRKPLLDSLAYLSWMLGDEAGFYETFTSGDPTSLTQKKMGNRRLQILTAALSATAAADVLEAEFIQAAIYSPVSDAGLYGLFQHAVHLVTVDRIELHTGPENFNFIFANYGNDDLYEGIYGVLPGVMLYLSNVILELFDRMTSMNAGAKDAFIARSKYGYHLVTGEPGASIVRGALQTALSDECDCAFCDTPLDVTAHNAARIILTDSFRCTKCRRVNGIPFSWSF